MDQMDFLNVIDKTPLVSIDLIVENAMGEVLLGKRTNRPAQDFWFVPGGRIVKNETIERALKRISTVELGFELSICQMELIGAFDHIYNDNYYGEPGINTHYVVLAFRTIMPEDCELKPDDQHSDMRWWLKNELRCHAEVHPNTQKYFSI
ncbi:MAG: GDP-mannose mannosyl hydrolase [Desulfobacteraceae bacterium]|nr:GDP-mannose mannosyl hydrolase [Desulfobacteraceae bacterium]